MLEQSKNTPEVANALRAITGQDFGEKASDWRQWAMRDPELRTVVSPVLVSDKDLMAAATQDLPATVSGQGSDYTVKVSLPEGRTQEVWIDFAQKNTDGEIIVQLITPCGDAVPRLYETVLKLNMAMRSSD